MATYLSKLKELLGIAETDPSKDGSLNFAIQSVIDAVKIYCNITDVPEGLTTTVVLMARDMYRADHPEETPMEVQSIKRGDTEYKFSAGSGKGDAFVKNYDKQLNAYRKLRW